jgi:hypothetical protein
MERLHFSAINEAYHKGILRSWEEGGCMEEITNRLGYRLSLTSTDFNEQVRPGGLLNLTVNITNTGFASLMNPRPLFVVLFPSPDGSGVRGEVGPSVKLELDPRTWEPGNSSFTASIRLPARIADGQYNLALWLPDEAESLQGNPLYAVQFANEGVWDESTGYNILGKVTVDSSATGSYKRTESIQVEELNSIQIAPLSTSTPASTAMVPAISGDLTSNPQISNDAESIILSLDYASGVYNAFQLFVDEDRDPKTGYVINGIGAETLFENHTWNIYSGSGNDWNWEPTEILIHFQDTGSRVSWNISRSLLRSSSFDVVFQLVDANWNTAFVTQKITYTIK